VLASRDSSGTLIAFATAELMDNQQQQQQASIAMHRAGALEALGLADLQLTVAQNHFAESAKVGDPTASDCSNALQRTRYLVRDVVDKLRY
jgi:hypothetical protein